MARGALALSACGGLRRRGHSGRCRRRGSGGRRRSRAGRQGTQGIKMGGEAVTRGRRCGGEGTERHRRGVYPSGAVRKQGVGVTPGAWVRRAGGAERLHTGTAGWAAEVNRCSVVLGDADGMGGVSSAASSHAVVFPTASGDRTISIGLSMAASVLCSPRGPVPSTGPLPTSLSQACAALTLRRSPRQWLARTETCRAVDGFDTARSGAEGGMR